MTEIFINFNCPRCKSVIQLHKELDEGIIKYDHTIECQCGKESKITIEINRYELVKEQKQ